MTFDEFRATGRDVADLATIEHADAAGFSGPGRVYADGLFIEAPQPYVWYCTIGSQSYTYYGAEGLLRAERALYEFALSEGYIAYSYNETFREALARTAKSSDWHDAGVFRALLSISTYPISTARRQRINATVSFEPQETRDAGLTP